ncbi:hypothetical protein FB565_007451 [Actinoplanes lutulentus]|uniref:hypothetical protein n=1 Tax=Actinoplanes lutulentus TaxID=1287878 RepID=UPI0011B93BB6|nr:hypothetical protein [Actinoplanes lutulentus]MBB2947680.1 hypothetical protein [Actinoplanes lutulentus]
MSDLLKTHIQNVLEANHADAGKIRQRITELEGEGRRIVTGGQLDDEAWDIIDWRTNEILAAGNDGLDGYEAAGKDLDPSDNWVHFDRILQDLGVTYVETPGLPESLANLIEDWALASDADEVAQVIGWAEDKIEEYQAEA